jgi:hypothetical protein
LAGVKTPSEEKLANSDLLTDGVYSARIQEAYEATARSGRPMIVAKLAVRDADGNVARKISLYLDTSSDGLILRHTAVACHAESKFNAGSVSAEDLVGHDVLARIGTAKKGKWPARNVILDVLPAEDPAAVPLLNKPQGLSRMELLAYIAGTQQSSYTDDIPSPQAADAAQLWMGESETVEAFAARKGMTVAQLEELADKWIAANGETTGRAKAKPRPDVEPTELPAGEQPAEPPPVVQPAEGESARHVFGNLPEGLARPYSKDPVPDEVLTSENISTAYRIQNAVKRRKPEAKLIHPADKYLAGRIVRAHEQRPGNG